MTKLKIIIKKLIEPIRKQLKGFFSEIQISYKGINFKIQAPQYPDLRQSIKLYGCYEPYMTGKLIKLIKEGDVVFDVGCAYGYYSLLAEKLNKVPERIYGFDNEKTMVKMFQRNNRKYLNSKMNIIPKFVGDINNNEKMDGA